MERTLVIAKPDALQRKLIGEIISRFERKGLKLIGLKMMAISDALIAEHYAHHADKPFFENLKKFMQSAPVVVMALEGLDAVESVRLVAGQTKSRVADMGTIRGDLAMSIQINLVHTSDSLENAKTEIARFFKEGELFAYQPSNLKLIYSPDELT
ncbi:MAG: nucleoside-diphosphate kinase [Parcubacteria group bacterium CG08_land_8_20_14_0_20_48_21]|nr:MAG: nucleoside-diphosphate kinase [Parcubacteria group bacterium CG2_30_48_51]PIS33238.1 MAG: nucleoside-diphosphate kinase [Parcubacteria group bacterium CG08_land_8_20_14_0_20_48_21]PIW79065.1 MAG: nucleoside-diphosphate kinase [Parcubacteria group bacterium CG_4_8_14_3_um_filter_48_16]PIY78119.1 MAG: nucleoside-diphosphate kinase [Parcubacteria group bacterium CG_4_10_14_0_8_um_filter_48_154]PIZ77046.1 MAG: nucleoside-diphosphate kinase [bacterium CG_4_10_14_0_2_um_filter_48_144]PJC3946